MNSKKIFMDNLKRLDRQIIVNRLDSHLLMPPLLQPSPQPPAPNHPSKKTDVACLWGLFSCDLPHRSDWCYGPLGRARGTWQLPRLMGLFPEQHLSYCSWLWISHGMDREKEPTKLPKRIWLAQWQSSIKCFVRQISANNCITVVP